MSALKKKRNHFVRGGSNFEHSCLFGGTTVKVVDIIILKNGKLEKSENEKNLEKKTRRYTIVFNVNQVISCTEICINCSSMHIPQGCILLGILWDIYMLF